ncbi:MAG TPA: PAS domain S-box protein, partial [Draconibacterium sp.]|nr:PAS domain S-box protein [Draconibacterium sp.]
LSGSEALEKTKEMELALAIIDVRMPKMNGHELALKLNEERSGVKVPIIFITANHFDEMEVFKGYDSGAVDYVFKPVNARILRSKINVFLDLFNQKQTIIRETKLLKKTADKLIRSNVALRKSEKKFRSYIDNAPDGIFVADETGRYVEVNEAACRITGYSKKELLKMSISDILPHESVEEGLVLLKKTVNPSLSKADSVFKHKNGTNQWWVIESVKLSENRFLCFAKDITVRKVAENLLMESQSNLEEAQQIAQMGSWQLDMNTNMVRWSKEMFHIYDINPKAFDGNPDKVIKVLHPDDVELFKNRMYNLTIGNSETIEYRVIHKDGSIHYLHGVGRVEIEKDGKPIRRVGTVQDVTERKLEEQALKASEDKYKTILNASPDGILIVNLKGIITEVSEIGFELLGTDNRGELIGKHFSRFIPSEEKNTIQEAIDKTMNEGIAQNVEIKIRKKNQSIFLSEISFTLIQSPGGALISFMITIRDISQRKKLEKKQIHADRMASLGEMASGIAHEINQPLNTISLVIDNILYKATKDENSRNDYLKKKSEKIFENITRIRNIIDHIRAFSRSNDDYILTGFDINLSINNAMTMISEQFEHLAIKLDLQLEKNLPLIIGNTFQFEQVILNLLSNAKDALIEKKNIRKEHFDMSIGIRSFKEDQNLIIEMTDNGTGINEEDIEHIILPFYTTKDTGMGTGLGLSISYQIIKEMNGTIEITSNKLTGTTFRIILKIQNKE